MNVPELTTNEASRAEAVATGRRLVASFVIPVRNDAERLRRCLASVLANASPDAPIEIIVADNGSTDGSERVAREAGARVLSLPGLRVSQLRNRAAASAAGEVLAFADADHEIDVAWVRAAVEAVRADGIAAAGAPYHAPPGGTWVQRTIDEVFRDHRPGVREVSWLGSGNLAVRRAVFEDVGGFDESLTACEDVDLCRRIRDRGWRIVQDGRLKSVHYGDPRGLRELFKSEMWRSRDNLRVSLRPPLTLRTVVSAAVPVAVLVSLVAATVGLAAAPWGGLLLAAPAAGIVLAPSAARAVRSGPGRLARAFAVALVYDVARAVALVVRAGHRRARPARAEG